MPNLPENQTWEPGIYQLETDDRVEGGVNGKANTQAKQLGNRTSYLKALLDGDQAGTFTAYNRGVVYGCQVAVSAVGTRNLDIAAGRAFIGGRELGVAEQEGGGAVPPNSTGQEATCWAYLTRDGDLVVTALDTPVPTDALELAELSVPNGNTEATDPDLSEVTITETVRREPGYPLLFQSPPETTPNLDPLINGDYIVTLEPVSWEGGEAPVLEAPILDRAGGQFKVRLIGLADSVVVRWRVRSL